MRKLLLFVVFAGLAHATTYTVKSSGGSFTTISSCASTAVAGDVCDVFTGSYGGWTEAASGSSGSPITFTVHSGQTATVTSGITISSRSWITLNGFAFNVSGNCVTGNGSSAHNVISNNTGTCGGLFRIPDSLGSGGSNNTISGNTIAASGNGNLVGLYLYGDSNLIDANDLSGFDGDCMDLGGQFVVVRNNKCHDLDGTVSAQHIDFVQVIGAGTTPTLSFSLIEGNTEQNCLNDSGNCHFILVRTGSGPVADTIIVRYNYAQNMNSSSGPIGFGGVGDSAPHNKLYNNTIATANLASGNGTCASWENASTGGAFNNICYNTMTGSSSFSPWFDFSSGGLTENGNLVFTPAYASSWGSPYSGEATYSALHNLNPSFANYPTDASLASGSGARGAGSKLTTVAAGDTGTGTSLVVTDAAFFQPGWAGTQGDWIRIGASTTAQISAINYSTNTITLTGSVSRSNADPIYLYKKSDGVQVLFTALPDVGAVPFIAAPTVTITGVSASPTQALVRFNALALPACTVQVSESQSLSPLDADTDPALFTNANTEAAHYAAVPWVSGTLSTRLLRIGLRKAKIGLDGRSHSLALAANTQHYVAITCNGVVATATFTTGVPGGIFPEGPPTDSAIWGQLAFPEFTSDFSKPVIDPHTGMKIYSDDPNGWTENQAVAMNTAAGWTTGGTGWTSFANLSNAPGGTMATTGNTNTATVFVDMTIHTDQISDGGGYWPYDNWNDIGLDIWGSGNQAATTDRTVNACISIDSGQTCYTPAIPQILPQTTAASNTVPNNYPTAYFAGWGKAIPRAYYNKCGNVYAASGLLTLVSDCTPGGSGGPFGIYTAGVNSNAYFNTDWVAGTKLYIAGSGSTCTNSFCTIATVKSSTVLTLVESLTLGSSGSPVAFKSAALAFIINKTTATGTVSMSVQFHVSKSFPHNVLNGGCASTTVTDTNGVVGYPCIFPQVRQGTGGLYFIGVSSPIVRLVSVFVNNPAMCQNGNANDCPATTASVLGPAVRQFDPADPTTIYTVAYPTVGDLCLFKLHYVGNWTTPYVHSTTQYGAANTTEMQITNLTPPSASLDFRTQILAASDNTYDEAKWHSLSGTMTTQGQAGPYTLLTTFATGQDSACFVFAFTSSTGTYYRQWRTDNGVSTPGLHYAGCHAVVPIDGATTATGPIFRISDNGLTSGFGGLLQGPFLTTPTHVYKSGSPNTNTTLPWPIDNTYDNTCPGGLPAWMVTNGAVGNQCVKMDLPQPCSATPAAGEATSYPCPYATTTKSSAGRLLPGDFLKDTTQAIPPYSDAEGFMYLGDSFATSATTSAITGGWFQRNANQSYCRYGNGGADGTSQMQHTTNGAAYAAKSSGSCNSNDILVDMMTTPSDTFPMNHDATRGHNDVTQLGVKTVTVDAAGAADPDGSGRSGYTFQFLRSWANLYLPVDSFVTAALPFATYQSSGGSQSYISCQQYTATADLKNYCFDFRHYNGNTGLDLENPGQTIGNNTNLSLVSGTSYVYTITPTGTVDIKHQALNVWAGHHMLIDISTHALATNTITDATPWTYCYAYYATECRATSAQGTLYISGPFDLKTSCWASQMNLNIPCAMAGPTEGGQAVQIRVSTPDPNGSYQRWLGQLLMGPFAQYVYSKVLPTPDASYLLFGGFMTSGYHTGLMMAKLPPFPTDNINRTTYVPIVVTGVGTSVKVKFWYDEYNGYCMTRAEDCYVAAFPVNETTPFQFASEAITPATGAYRIAIPALSGHLLYYQVVDSGKPSLTQAVVVP